MVDSAQVLIVDNSYIKYEQSQSHQLCLNFQIKNPQDDIAYLLRLYLQDSAEVNRKALGVTQAQFMDNNVLLLVFLPHSPISKEKYLAHLPNTVHPYSF